MDDADAFIAHRELMFSMAYRMLGTVADAEDAVQDAWLRWSAAPRDDVADPRAYLARTVTNIALNRLRSSANHAGLVTPPERNAFAPRYPTARITPSSRKNSASAKTNSAMPVRS